MQIQQKGNEWLVYDDTGLKRFDSEKEAREYMGEPVSSQEKPSMSVSIKDEDLFSSEI